jgi:ATP-dependent DNA helicase PIF1
MLNELNEKQWKIRAYDHIKGKRVNVKLTPKECGGLEEEIILSKNARVMLIRNLDVSQGLVNGAQGIILDLVHSEMEKNTPSIILVQFDDENVGTSFKSTKKFPQYPTAVPITQFEVSCQNASRVMRRQFPLTLCFGTTIHKVQGLSLDQIVVSFAGQFRGGQAYVALSRAKTLNGLYLTDFNKAHHKIIENPGAVKEMTELRTKAL